VSSYKRVIIFFFLIFFVFGCSKSQSELLNTKYTYKSFAGEDKYVMFALEHDRTGQKEQANELYLKLFNQTFKEEYLLEYAKSSFNLKKFDEILNIIDSNKDKISTSEDPILRIYILALLQKKDYDTALIKAKELLEKYNSDINSELLANIYVHKKEYKKAKEVYLKIYTNSLTPISLINLVNIMYVYLDEKDRAINYLESHIKLYGCNNLICPKLLSFYQEQNNIDGVISVLKTTYYEYKDDVNSHFSIDKVYKLLMYYLEKKDIKEAILFLENSSEDQDKLFTLYRNDSQYKKALSLVKELYEKSGNIDYLAQIAMLEFEIVKDKKSILKSVIKKFEDVLTVLDNHIYQNYLGYILIDYDVDVKKGLEYVNKALEKAPNNLAYIDSLAWGQYKLKDCKSALINMKKVVDGAGLNDKEIKIHWNKIKECSK
jgi:tetratricopeptide (TPR) repeat protein